MPVPAAKPGQLHKGGATAARHTTTAPTPVSKPAAEPLKPLSAHEKALQVCRHPNASPTVLQPGRLTHASCIVSCRHCVLPRAALAHGQASGSCLGSGQQQGTVAVLLTQQMALTQQPLTQQQQQHPPGVKLAVALKSLSKSMSITEACLGHVDRAVWR